MLLLPCIPGNVLARRPGTPATVPPNYQAGLYVSSLYQDQGQQRSLSQNHTGACHLLQYVYVLFASKQDGKELPCLQQFVCLSTGWCTNCIEQLHGPACAYVRAGSRFPLLPLTLQQLFCLHSTVSECNNSRVMQPAVAAIVCIMPSQLFSMLFSTLHATAIVC